jgi:glucose-1-phosphate thymidylyltransferase
MNPNRRRMVLHKHLSLVSVSSVIADVRWRSETYGVVEFDKDSRAIGLEEKPEKARSRYAVTGLYFYDNDVVDIAKTLLPSARGELEITDINKQYLEAGKLHTHIMGRGTMWLDTGTPKSLLAASTFIESIENRQGLKISCLEEIAYRMGFIDGAQLASLAAAYGEGDYGQYLTRVLDETLHP